MRGLPLVVAAFVLLWSAPASAHSGPAQVSPEALSTVGGEVITVALVFVEPLTEVELEVVGPDGRALAGTLARPQSHLAELAIDPIEAPGSYLVRYRVTFEDGAEFSGEHRFTYDPAAPQPVDLPRVVPVDVTSSASGVSPLLIVGGPVVVLAAAGVLLRRRQQSSSRR